ncbi:unnamed protein product [Sphenostylis stenocarpa]|uniref:Uncharacterized protein n=1 Tax=Sphenostylis stenocarpa TaxID=92480 RepID=A0AA86VFU3_9FABA|nr:unnamed protein product [Sphenostylis stenocarpa]
MMNSIRNFRNRKALSEHCMQFMTTLNSELSIWSHAFTEWLALNCTNERLAHTSRVLTVTATGSVGGEEDGFRTTVASSNDLRFGVTSIHPYTSNKNAVQNLIYE